MGTFHNLSRVCLILLPAARSLLKPVLVAVMTMALFGCGDATWHQKITIEVETPAGTVSGSSVQKAIFTSSSGWWVLPEARRARTRQLGEAAFVEVAPGRYLFGLLGKPSVFAVLFPGRAPKDVARELPKLRQRREIPPKENPQLVTFRSIDDPTTVEPVDPNNLAANFGPGVQLKSMTLEITNEPVTHSRIERVLGWLGKYPEPSLCKPPTPRSYPFCSTVHHGDFIRR